MGSLRKTQRLLLIFTLCVIIEASLAQTAGASVFFDEKVTLRWKSDPALRAYIQGKTGNDTTSVNVLLVFSTIPSANELMMLASLCELQTFTGHVATVNSPVNQLPKLASLPFVTQIAMPRVLKPELDVSVPEILADQVWNTAKYPGIRDSRGNVVNGTGVIIGFDDVTGIDYLHKDFYYKNGTNKVLYIWDQSSQGTPPDGYQYGNECTPSQIQAQTCIETDSSPDAGDTTGHGTAVAAVAASTGQASNNYFGVAPGASIIEVKLKDGSENYVIDAFSYMISKARQLNRPLVIVHSLGDTLGSHDGTEPLELAFTDFVSQGVPIVVAAGNDRGASLHVSGSLSPGEAVHVPWSMSGNENQIDLWYSTANILALSVMTPSGVVVAGPTPDPGIQTVDGNVFIQSDGRPSGNEWWISVTAIAQASLPSSAWKFILTSVSGPAGRWDAWTEPGQFVGSNETIADKYSIDPSDTIDSPGTARGVITVGAYMTKYSWWARCTTCIEWATDNGYKGFWWTPTYAPGEGQLLYFNTSRGIAKANVVGGPGVGQILYFSGGGPTRDGRMKPEVDAPGANIATARASTAPERNSDPDDYHQVWVGTSFAAPHVGGVIALMLQMNPYLSPNEITNILETDARQDNFTGSIDKSVGSPLWGWGKVNALRSTIDAPSLYSAWVKVESVGQPLYTNLNLDGTAIDVIPLNVSKTVTLEFRKGGNHTIELTPIIAVGPGARYALSDSSWAFSSGGTKTFIYQLQYYLQVNSLYGYASGSGWYNANTTAHVGITPTTVDSHDFEGWTGAIVLDQPTLAVKMDSTKVLTARWTSEESPSNTLLFDGLLVVMALVISAAFMTRRSLRERLRPRLSADSPQRPA